MSALEVAHIDQTNILLDYESVIWLCIMKANQEILSVTGNLLPGNLCPL